MENKILELLKNGFNSIKPVIDVENVIGSPVDMPNGDKVFPLVKISIGYVAGGGEYANRKFLKSKTGFPFAGGTSSGSCAEPVGFLIVKKSRGELIKWKCFRGHCKKGDRYPCAFC